MWRGADCSHCPAQLLWTTKPSLPSLKLELLSSTGSECRRTIGLQDESWLLLLWTSSRPWLHLCTLLSSKLFSNFGSFLYPAPEAFKIHWPRELSSARNITSYQTKIEVSKQRRKERSKGNKKEHCDQSQGSPTSKQGILKKSACVGVFTPTDKHQRPNTSTNFCRGWFAAQSPMHPQDTLSFPLSARIKDYPNELKMQVTLTHSGPSHRHNHFSATPSSGGSREVYYLW